MTKLRVSNPVIFAFFPFQGSTVTRHGANTLIEKISFAKEIWNEKEIRSKGKF